MIDDHTVIGRAITILDVVVQSDGAVSLAALTRRTGLPKSTVRRIAGDLTDKQMLRGTPAGYLPGHRLVHQGLRATGMHGIAGTVQPYLQDLHHRSRGELAWYATVDAGELVIATAVFGHAYGDIVGRGRWPNMSILGSSIVLTAAGRLQVAHHPEQAERILYTGCRPLTRYSITDRPKLKYLLDQARDTGLATEAEQVMNGWSCSAAAIYDTNGVMTGALGLIGRNSDYARGLAGQVQKLSRQLEQDTTESRTRNAAPNPLARLTSKLYA